MHPVTASGERGKTQHFTSLDSVQYCTHGVWMASNRLHRLAAFSSKSFHTRVNLHYRARPGDFIVRSAACGGLKATSYKYGTNSATQLVVGRSVHDANSSLSSHHSSHSAK